MCPLSNPHPKPPALIFYLPPPPCFPGPQILKVNPHFANPSGHRYTCTCTLDDVCRPVAAGGAGSGNGGMAVRFGSRDRPSCCPGCQKVCHCLSCLTTHVLDMCSVILQACSETAGMHSADMSIGLSCSLAILIIEVGLHAHCVVLWLLRRFFKVLVTG